MPQVPKWKIIEGVVAAFEHAWAPAGAVVTANARVPYREAPNRTRQVDVHVSIPVGPRTLTVGIEVKNHNRPLTVEMVECVGAKLRKLSLDKRILVSRSGFCEGTGFDAREAGLDIHPLTELDKVSWWFGPLVSYDNLRQIELIHTVFAYSQTPIEINKEMVDHGIERMHIVGSNGRVISVRAFAESEGMRFPNEPVNKELLQGDLFHIKLPVPEGSIRSIRIEDRDLPPPLEIVFSYRFHDRGWTTTPVEAYELHGHQGVSMLVDIAGQTKQFTLVGERAPEKIVIAPARPRATRIRPDEDAASKKTASKKTASKKTPAGKKVAKKP